jgi:hypothetical protein
LSEPRLCIVDHRTQLGPTELQTCVRCLGATRRDLLDIADMYPLLDTELTERAGAATPPEPNGHIHGEGDPLPGGDIMVMLGPGSTRPHSEPINVDSILGVFERWDTDWRITFGADAATTPATVTNCAEYLLRHLGHAAQKHPAFDEFAGDINRLRHAMETVLRSGPQRSPVPCLTCGHRGLERPEPRDDGRRFEWQCARCHRNYTQEEFWMAVRQQGEAM